MRAYVSGGISGLDKTMVTESFHASVVMAKCIGGVVDVVNPWSLYMAEWTQVQYMECWVSLIEYSVDVMVMLEGWEKSKGACEEHAVALRLGLSVYYMK